MKNYNLESILFKDREIRCPQCGKSHFWKHGHYVRRPIQSPSNGTGLIRVPRYLCRNPACLKFDLTFSLLSFPLLPRIGVDYLELRQIFRYRDLSLKRLAQNFLDWTVSTLRGWKKMGDVLDSWAFHPF